MNIAELENRIQKNNLFKLHSQGYPLAVIKQKLLASLTENILEVPNIMLYLKAGRIEGVQTATEAYFCLKAGYLESYATRTGNLEQYHQLCATYDWWLPDVVRAYDYPIHLPINNWFPEERFVSLISVGDTPETSIYANYLYQLCQLVLAKASCPKPANAIELISCPKCRQPMLLEDYDHNTIGPLGDDANAFRICAKFGCGKTRGKCKCGEGYFIIKALVCPFCGEASSEADWEATITTTEIKEVLSLEQLNQFLAHANKMLRWLKDNTTNSVDSQQYYADYANKLRQRIEVAIRAK